MQSEAMRRSGAIMSAPSTMQSEAMRRSGAMTSASAPTKPGTTGQRETAPVDATASPWVTIVWDDPVNLMNYVTYIFQKLFGYSEPHATKLMLQVHNEGKAVVSSGSRESMEVDVSKLHAAGLWATMQQDR
jgi:ATP-dependent Clp protease adaptor protein ClpS